MRSFSWVLTSSGLKMSGPACFASTLKHLPSLMPDPASTAATTCVCPSILCKQLGTCHHCRAMLQVRSARLSDVTRTESEWGQQGPLRCAKHWSTIQCDASVIFLTMAPLAVCRGPWKFTKTKFLSAVLAPPCGEEIYNGKFL